MSDRLYKTAAATTPPVIVAPPNAIFDFQPVPQGIVYTGTIQIQNAPSYAFHSATVGGILWAEWIGYQPSPVIQAIGGEVVEVTSTLLNSGVTYQASWIGTVDSENNYIPVWPEASINPNLQQAINIQTFNLGTLVTGTKTASVNTGVPGQVLAIQYVQTGGTANGFFLQVGFGGTNGSSWTLYPANVGNTSNSWWYVPIVDTTTQISVTPLLNGVASGAATMSGTLRIAILPGPLFSPVLNSGLDASTPSLGLQSFVSAPAAGVTTALLPTNPTGTIYLIRGISMSAGGAPAAAGIVQINGNLSNQPYFRTAFSTTPPIMLEDSGQWYVGDNSANADPTEGLNVVNSLSAGTTISVGVRYDILPFRNQ